MFTKPGKKLNLKKSTVSNLRNSEMNGIYGGVTKTYPTYCDCPTIRSCFAPPSECVCPVPPTLEC